jgi:hypothetical protein
LAQVGASAFQTRLRHTGDVEQLVERCKRALELSQLDDALRDRASDARDASKIARGRMIDVDAAGSRRSVAVTAPTVRQRASSVSLARSRHVDLVAVLRVRREIDSGGICARTKTPGECDRPCVTIARAEVIETRPGDGAGHVHHSVVVPRAMRAATRPLKGRCR